MNFLKLFIFLFIINSALAQNGVLAPLINERNRNADILVPENFVSFEVRALENARTLYVNNRIVEEMGIDLSAINNEALRKEVVKAFGWISSQTSPQPGAETRIAYADFYGGEGMGHHHGSARAGIMGQVQIKGIGTTPLHKGNHGGKHDGRAGFHEAIKEVIWGNLLNNELPFGANRVVALVDTGLKKQNGEPHVLIVREDPLRAGHFVIRTYHPDSADKARVLGNLINLPKAIPGVRSPNTIFSQYFTESTSSQFKELALTVEEWLDRLSQQIARNYVRKMFHGATSESNININGEFIDYGTASTNSGYGKISFLSHIESFGEFSEVNSLWGEGLTKRFFLGLSRKQINRATTISLNKILRKIWDKKFQEAMSKEFLLILGFPKGKLKAISQTDEALALTKKLLLLTQKSSIQRVIDIQNNPTPENSSKIDFQRFFISLANSSERPDKLNRFLLNQNHISPRDAEEIKALFNPLFERAKEDLKALGVPEDQVSKHFKARAEWFNRNLPELYINNLKTFTTNLFRSFEQGTSIETLQRKVDELIARNTKEINKIPDFLAPKSLELQGDSLILKAFNAKTNEEQTFYLKQAKGRVFFPPSEQYRGCHGLLRGLFLP